MAFILSVLAAYFLLRLVFLKQEEIYRKKKEQPTTVFWFFFINSVVYYVFSWALVELFCPISPFSKRLHVALALLALGYLLLNVFHILFISYEKNIAGLAFQVFNFLLIVSVAFVADSYDPITFVAGFHDDLRRYAERILGISIIYYLVIFWGGSLIRRILKPMTMKLEASSDDMAEGLEKAGLYIGLLERFLILSAFVTNSPTTAGLIVAAKSILRFPEIKGRPFAEYFLIGTLISVSLAFLGSLAIKGFLVVIARP